MVTTTAAADQASVAGAAFVPPARPRGGRDLCQSHGLLLLLAIYSGCLPQGFLPQKIHHALSPARFSRTLFAVEDADVVVVDQVRGRPAVQVVLGHAGLGEAGHHVGGALGKPLIGWIADRFNGARRIPAMVVLGCFSVMLVVFGLLDNAVAFFIAAPLLGLGAYCYLPLIVALVPRLVSSNVVGSAAGLSNAMWQIGSVLVPLAVGAVFAATNNSFMAAVITLAAGPFVGMIFMYFVNERPDDVEIAINAEGNA
jgi:hypothetical protein